MLCRCHILLLSFYISMINWFVLFVFSSLIKHDVHMLISKLIIISGEKPKTLQQTKSEYCLVIPD